MATRRRQQPIGTDEHLYIRGPAEHRGPCPALNALANQGYLNVTSPRHGRNLTVAQVQGALRSALWMTPALAASNTRQLKPILRSDGTFDLTDLSRHGVIEHDRSFTRLDFGHGGDNYTLQPDMFRALLDDARGGPLTVKTLARTFRRRAEEHIRSGGKPLTLQMWLVNLAQSVSFLNVAEKTGGVSREVVDAFYLEERFSEEVLGDERPRTLFGLVGWMLRLLVYVYVLRV
ncbi:hypothetical protein CDD80_4734 [Ophiocordyceps camponoti-rufipedis]|uniref:Heme haloperoxidase family profile domain-containing protein n=1 Tax=Ophiocordyceps camponoti-rufipedis TaxID=2004952 RepID=A0A2C5YRK4_9HYPO|nr:hypothetical protein CDD80_4734 [Ophiocordyceps camponoti-rufipedis]